MFLNVNSLPILSPHRLRPCGLFLGSMLGALSAVFFEWSRALGLIRIVLQTWCGKCDRLYVTLRRNVALPGASGQVLEVRFCGLYDWAVDPKSRGRVGVLLKGRMR